MEEIQAIKRNTDCFTPNDKNSERRVSNCPLFILQSEGKMTIDIEIIK